MDYFLFYLCAGIPLVTGIRPLALTAGESMALICTVDFNYPAGAVSWSRADGVDLPSERFTVNSEGELVVTPVIVEDESEYLCTVTNVYGSSTIKAFIVVHGKFMIYLCTVTNVYGSSTIKAFIVVYGKFMIHFKYMVLYRRTNCICCNF